MSSDGDGDEEVGVNIEVKQLLSNRALLESSLWRMPLCFRDVIPQLSLR